MMLQKHSTGNLLYVLCIITSFCQSVGECLAGGWRSLAGDWTVVGRLSAGCQQVVVYAVGLTWRVQDVPM